MQMNRVLIAVVSRRRWKSPALKMTGQLRANWIREIQSHAGWAISLLVLVFGAGTLVMGLAAAWAGVRFNDSRSMPSGFYVRVSSESKSSLAVFCPDGGEPLAKPIAARVGDTVELSATGMAVNGRLLPNTAPLVSDTAGRPLVHWPFGRYVVAPGTVWVASSYSRRSFDSRYFGPVEASQVREHVRPLLTSR
jgi:type IV secretory pathway protease TraF